MSRRIVTVSLDDVLNAVVGRVSIRGVDYDVLGLDAAGYDMVRAIQDAADALADGRAPDPDTPDVPEVLACVRRLVPSMPAEIFATMTGPACGPVLEIAQGGIARVSDALPNSSGPTTSETPAAPSPESPAT